MQTKSQKKGRNQQKKNSHGATIENLYKPYKGKMVPTKALLPETRINKTTSPCRPPPPSSSPPPLSSLPTSSPQRRQTPSGSPHACAAAARSGARCGAAASRGASPGPKPPPPGSSPRHRYSWSTSLRSIDPVYFFGNFVPFFVFVDRGIGDLPLFRRIYLDGKLAYFRSNLVCSVMRWELFSSENARIDSIRSWGLPVCSRPTRWWITSTTRWWWGPGARGYGRRSVSPSTASTPPASPSSSPRAPTPSRHRWGYALQHNFPTMAAGSVKNGILFCATNQKCR